MNGCSGRARSAAVLFLASLLAFLVPITSTHAESQKVRLIQSQAEGWTRNVDVLLSAFTEDVVYVDLPLGITLQGKDQIRQFAEGFFQAFPDLKSVCGVIVVNGNHGFCEWRFTGTQVNDLPNIPARGGAMVLPGVSHYEFEGNKIKRVVDYWDLNTLLKQLAEPAEGK